MIDTLQLFSVVGIFAASFGAVYHKMMGMQKDISVLRTKMDFVYDNLSVALNFKENK